MVNKGENIITVINYIENNLTEKLNLSSIAMGVGYSKYHLHRMFVETVGLSISSAVDGNVNSIEKILAFYDPYISKCCLRPFYDRYGNVCIVVDMELKGRIREALIKMILDFDISLETEE